MTCYKNELQTFIANYLPAVQRLEFHVLEATPERVILGAPLNINTNDKLTAFGGSQQMLALTSAWSLVYVNLIDAELKEQQFVVSEVNTKYKKPVRSDIFYAVAQRDDKMIARFTAQSRTGESSRTMVRAHIYKQELIDALLKGESLDEENAATRVDAEFATIG